MLLPRRFPAAPLKRFLTRESLDLALLGICLLGLIVFAVHGPFGAGDIKVYHRYALNFWTGAHAFQALPLEYPALSIALFTLTLLPPIADYVTVYAIWMAVLFLAGYLAFRRFSSPHNASVYAVYLLLGATAALLGRFDLVPSLLVMGAVWAAARRKFLPAYLLLTLGGLLKLYPLALLPLLIIEHRRFLVSHDRPWKAAVARGVAASGGFLLAIFGIAFALAGWDSLSPFYYAGARPLQVESLGATLLWFGSFLGFPAVTQHGFSSYNLVGPLDGGIIATLSFAGLAGLGWVYWRAWTGRMDLPRAFLAAICVILLTSKVFSPQYLIWALPLVVEVEGIDLLWLVICACTTLIYPVLYVNDHIFGTPGPLPYSGGFLGTIAVRNLILATATARILLGGRARSEAGARGPIREGGSLSITGD